MFASAEDDVDELDLNEHLCLLNESDVFFFLRCHYVIYIYIHTYVCVQVIMCDYMDQHMSVLVYIWYVCTVWCLMLFMPSVLL